MSKSNVTIKEILPKKERVYDRAVPCAILCKPKLLPLRIEHFLSSLDKVIGLSSSENVLRIIWFRFVHV
ncbi:---NA--- [Octopus vulgaris]|uniref:---NA n=1 Tax=Octopus vulgaris TaxID=6645 RepID=A0AA36BXS9_OCTVU|nr:---NA--- [Octopus vulgaris]